MAANERKTKRCAYDDSSNPKKPSKRSRNNSVMTPDAVQSDSNVVDAQDTINPLRISFHSRLTPILSMTPQITTVFSTATDQTPLYEKPCILSVCPVSSMAKSIEQTQNIPVSADSVTDQTPFSYAGPHPSILSQSLIKNLNYSRVSLVPTENASENDFELDAEEISFRDWESSTEKGITMKATVQYSWFNNFVGIGLLLSLLIVTLLWTLQGPHLMMYIQGASELLLAPQVLTPENGDNKVQLTQTEKQLEAAVHELQSTSSELQSSQQRFETVSQELEQGRLKISDLEQQLQETTTDIESTKKGSQIATQLLGKTKTLLQIQEKQLMVSQLEVTRQQQELQQSYHQRESAFAEAQAAVHAMSQTHKELEEIRSLLRFKDEQVQQVENSQTQLQHSLFAANLDNFGITLELSGLRNEISDLQSLHVSQAHDLIVARHLGVELARKAADATTAEQAHLEAFIQMQNELATQNGAMEQLATTLEDLTKKLIDFQNESVETHELLSQTEQKLLLLHMSHLRTKDELFYTISELWEHQIALNDIIEVLLDSEEMIDRLIRQNDLQEKLSTFTVNFVATRAINIQQQAAAEAVNFMTTFASKHYRDIPQGHTSQKVPTAHDDISYFE